MEITKGGYMIASITKQKAREILDHLQLTRQAFCFDETGAIWSAKDLTDYLNDN